MASTIRQIFESDDEKSAFEGFMESYLCSDMDVEVIQDRKLLESVDLAKNLTHGEGFYEG